MSKLAAMKGDSYSEKRLRKWLKQDGAVVVQIKRDEFRCIVKMVLDADGNPAVQYLSAQGKPLHNLSFADQYWIDLATITGQTTFDCGVVVNNDFDLTRRTVRASKKKYDLSGQSVQEIVERKKGEVLYSFKGKMRAVFWLYDLPELNLSYEKRRLHMSRYTVLIAEMPLETPESEVIGFRAGAITDEVVDAAVQDVKDVFAQVRNQGHEGLMIKRINYVWEPKRCADSWMKLKPDDEVDGQIVSYTPGKGKYADMVGSLNCVAADGSEFSVSGMTDAQRRDFTDNFEDYINQWLVATYMERDSKGGYRHPQFKRMHAEKNL